MSVEQRVRSERVTPEGVPRTAITQVLQSGVGAGLVFWVLLPTDHLRLVGAVVLAVTGGAVAASGASARLAGTVGALWSVVAVGAAVQIRLTPDVAARVLGITVAGAAALVAARVVAARAMRADRERRHRRSAGETVGVVLLGAALLVRLLPAVDHRLANGGLELPLVGLVQVGEFTRPMALVGAALVLDALVAGRRTATGDRPRRWARGAWLVLAGYLALLLVKDSGPAVLTAVGLLAIVVVSLPALRLRLYDATLAGHRPGRSARAATGAGLVAVGLAGVAAALWRAGTVDRWADRVALIGDPQEQLLWAAQAAHEGGLVGSGLGSSSLVTAIPVGGSDMLPATVGAELGLLTVGVVVGLVVVLLGRLAREVTALGGPVAAGALGVACALVAQTALAVLGAFGFVPMTGISAPFLMVGGSALIPAAAAVGSCVGVLEGARDARPRRGAAPSVQAVAVAIVVACVAVALLPAPGDGWATIMRPRGEIRTRDGVVVAQATSGGSSARVYPQGVTYADLGALISRSRAFGMESTFGEDLTCGGRLSWQQRLGSLLHPSPCVPADVVLTLDGGVQAAATAAMADLHGSVVVMDSADGSVLALYSTDQKDPNTLTAGDEVQAPSRLASLAPGSVVKPMVAVAGLVEGVSTHGAPAEVLEVGGQSLHNNDGTTCPDDTLGTALKLSCNTTFGYLGTRIGADRLAADLGAYAGADRDLPYDGGDAAGLVTGLDAGTTPAALARSAIGQESVRASPLAVAAMTASLAHSAAGHDGGTPAPHVLALVCSGGREQRAGAGTPWAEPVPVDVATQVVDGMRLAAAHGTVRALGAAGERLDREVAAKSGTADVTASESETAVLRWVTAVVDGRWVVTVLVRDETAGSANAAVTAAARLLAAVPTSTTAPTC